MTSTTITDLRDDENEIEKEDDEEEETRFSQSGDNSDIPVLVVKTDGSTNEKPEPSPASISRYLLWATFLTTF